MKNLSLFVKIIFPIWFITSIPTFAESKATEKSMQNHETTSAYEKGKILYDQKKYSEAFPLLLKAAEMGHADAQMHIGKMYYNGWGVEHSHEKGKEWHEKAAKQGNQESIQKLENMRTHKGPSH